MSEELRVILHDAYVKERKLNMLYSSMVELDVAEDDGFFRMASDDQEGGIQVLQEINQRYGNEGIESSILERLGESILQIRSGRAGRDKLLEQIMEFESELVEDYKKRKDFL